MKPKKYAIYSTFKEDNHRDLNALNTNERKLTKAYELRKDAIFYCTCNEDKPSPMAMSVNGKLYDISPSHSTHIENCERYKDRTIYGGMRCINFNPEKPELLFNEFEEKANIDVRENIGGKDRRPYNYREARFLSIITQAYSENERKHDGYDLIRVAAKTYTILTKATYKTDKGTELKANVKVGIFKEIITKGNKSVVSIFIRGGKFDIHVPAKALKKAVNSFKKIYGKSVNECKDVLAIYVSFDKQDNKKSKVKDQMMFVLTSRCGIPCESLFEKRVYDIYENELCKPFNKDFVFNKNYQKCVYQDIDNVINYLDDGEFKLINTTNKRIVVLEVFGLTHKKDYMAVCEEKRELLGLDNSLYLLEILPEDNDASIVAKLNTALEWLRNPSVSA